MELDVTVGMRSDASVVDPNSFGKGFTVKIRLEDCKTDEERRLHWRFYGYKHKPGYVEDNPIARRAERLTREAIAKREAERKAAKEQENNNKNN